MATTRSSGRGQTRAQVNTITPANVGIGNIFSVVINTKTYSFTATAGTVANVTAGLVALLQASDEGEFAELTFTDSTTHITVTGPSDGRPFTQTSSASGGTATNTTATTVAALSKHDVADADNWTEGAAPDTGDTVFFENSDVSALYNLSGFSTNALTSLNVEMSFEAFIGLKEINTDGTAYREYRATYLVCNPTILNVGLGVGQGSGRLMFDGNGQAAAINVYNTGSPEETAREALLLKNFASTSELNIMQGSVGLAVLPEETATMPTIRMADGNLRCGAGCTLTTITISGGTLETNSAFTTGNLNDGAWNHKGPGAITTLNIKAGSFTHQGIGTITTLAIGNGGVFDAGNDPRALTITNTTLRAGATLIDRTGRITHTNAISCPDGFDKVTIVRPAATVQFT